MGYRNYIGSLPKREYNKIKNYTLEEVYKHKGIEWNEDNEKRVDYVGVYDIAYNMHYELGKYVDEFDKKLFKPVFKNKETQKEFECDSDFYIVQKEFVLKLIEYYTGIIKNYYTEMLKDFFDGRKVKSDFLKNKDSKITEIEEESIFKIIEHVRSMSYEWIDFVPYNLNLDTPNIVSSWKYEYVIFELVRLYKTFDWKRNIMIYYGY